jgi:hypothetical protein
MGTSPRVPTGATVVSRNLSGVHLVMRGNLRDGLLPADRFQRHLCLEFLGMVTSWLSHGLLSGQARTEFHLSPYLKFQDHLCHSGLVASGSA